MVGDTGLVYL